MVFENQDTETRVRQGEADQEPEVAGSPLADGQAADGAQKGGEQISGRRMKSRRKLLDAARSLFVERGYHDTRPQDISKAAGVGHGTFYLHFQDKLACFLAFADEASAELEVIVERHVENTATLEAIVREIILAIYEYSDEHPGVLAAAMTDINVLSTEDVDRVMPIDRWAAGWADILTEKKAAGDVDASIDEKMAGYLIVGAFKHAGGYAARQEMPFEDYVDGLMKLLMKMLKP